MPLPSANKIVGVLLNAATRQVTFYTQSGLSPALTVPGTGAIFGAFSSGGNLTSVATINAGQATFFYTLPSGATPWGDSSFVTASEVNASLAAKQNTLVSGTNIKTVNGVSLLGSGDVQIALNQLDPIVYAIALG
jgi:hypothetical protein